MEKNVNGELHPYYLKFNFFYSDGLKTFKLCQIFKKLKSITVLIHWNKDF